MKTIEINFERVHDGYSEGENVKIQKRFLVLMFIGALFMIGLLIEAIYVIHFYDDRIRPGEAATAYESLVLLLELTWFYIKVVGGTMLIFLSGWLPAVYLLVYRPLNECFGSLQKTKPINENGKESEI